MLLKNRKYAFQEPDRDAKKIFIYCEGAKRERDYFKFFEKFDSRLHIIVYELKDTEDNSAVGLMNIAKRDIAAQEVIEGDEIWIVLDTDTYGNAHRVSTLIKLREECSSQNWNVAQSNPCFEVWLYYHQESEKPTFEGIDVPSVWKTQVSQIIRGGFNAKKHPILLPIAIKNAEENFVLDSNRFPDVASTEVFKLASNILALGKVKMRLAQELQDMTKNVDTQK